MRDYSSRGGLKKLWKKDRILHLPVFGLEAGLIGKLMTFALFAKEDNEHTLSKHSFLHWERENTNMNNTTGRCIATLVDGEKASRLQLVVAKQRHKQQHQSVDLVVIKYR